MYKVVSSLSGRFAGLTGQSCCSSGFAKFHLGSGAVCQQSAFKYSPADLPEMPRCDLKPEEYKGMSKEQMMKIRRQNCNPVTMKITYYKKPVFIHQGHMQWLWDVDGRRYLDLFAGVATVSVGHCHPKLTAAAAKQLKRLWHTTNIYVHPNLHEYCEKLASLLPDPLKVIAWQMRNTSDSSKRHSLQVFQVKSLLSLESRFSTNMLASFIMTQQVQTGFGRTGTHFWGFQGYDVIPDMVTMAKGIGNGFPVGAVVTTPEIAASFGKAYHFNTFGGSPIACAVASSVLDTIKEDGLQQNSHNVGTYLLTEMAKLRDKYEIIGDVRGKGLQIGVEMVKDKASREPLSPEAMSEIFEDIKDMGVLIGKGGVYGQTFRIQPPMCITNEDVDFFLAVFNKAVHNYLDRK
ncbi:Alanine--glyoxylate aminotransferase 2, mitochondrial [Larimichthys crocea]|uniref:Uncharacterized protein n=1 Tax=Larimichthys crocea TaxID=215358 RepID=A0ACD3QMB0_LARCR|nr:Alanine--glyoxylate aminotransferase 2, mitochondrial [Larimichthys crocea]